MTIICGTDLSESAVRAAHAAAAIAQRLHVPLKLVHVLHGLGAGLAVMEEGEAAFAVDRARVRAEAEDLRKRFEIDVEPIVVPGRADTQIATIAAELHAQLVVVAAVGRTQRHRWLLGSMAEQIARRSPAPVLVVRDARPLTAWARGQRALEIMVGVELSSSSRDALRWAAGLRRIGPCDLRIVQLVSPVDEHVRLGVASPDSSASLERLHPDLEHTLLRDLRAWVGAIPGPGKTVVEVRGHGGAIDWRLSQLAEAADLLVVGTHQRVGFDRVWHGSVSRGVLKHASSNIACVPQTESLARTTQQVRIHSVLVSTDFSPLANRAIPFAYALAAPGGVVHMIHVVRPAAGDVARLRQSLQELVPPDTIGTVATELHVIEADDPATAIWQAAGRLGVDLVCMATRGRSGLLGSQAQRVVAKVRQPVVLVPPERIE
jgi:nucleotide-binding universal stress UspA family protein